MEAHIHSPSTHHFKQASYIITSAKKKKVKKKFISLQGGIFLDFLIFGKSHFFGFSKVSKDGGDDNDVNFSLLFSLNGFTIRFAGQVW